MARHIEFKRMVLGLPSSASDYEMVQMTAKFAELLRVNLIGMFVEDRDLINIATLPCVRELRAFGDGWKSIEIEQFKNELAQASETAHRLFANIARNCSVETSFRIEHGSPADIIGSIATAEDIVVIIEPRNPIERVSQRFTRIIDAAFRASAAVMIVPSRVARIAGAIVAVAADPRDPSIGVAMAIAAAAHEKVVIVGSFKETELSASLASPYKSLGIRSEFIGSKKGALNATALGDDLRQLSKRLIIISRGTLSDVDALRLASLQSTPVVITEPARSANQDANSR